MYCFHNCVLSACSLAAKEITIIHISTSAQTIDSAARYVKGNGVMCKCTTTPLFKPKNERNKPGYFARYPDIFDDSAVNGKLSCPG